MKHVIVLQTNDDEPMNYAQVNQIIRSLGRNRIHLAYYHLNQPETGALIVPNALRNGQPFIIKEL